jgi:hypothetical protein
MKLGCLEAGRLEGKKVRRGGVETNLDVQTENSGGL